MTGHGHALAPTLGTLAWLVALLLVFAALFVRAFSPRLDRDGRVMSRARTREVDDPAPGGSVVTRAWRGGAM